MTTIHTPDEKIQDAAYQTGRIGSPKTRLQWNNHSKGLFDFRLQLQTARQKNPVTLRIHSLHYRISHYLRERRQGLCPVVHPNITFFRKHSPV